MELQGVGERSGGEKPLIENRKCAARMNRGNKTADCAGSGEEVQQWSGSSYMHEEGHKYSCRTEWDGVSLCSTQQWGGGE